MTQTSEPKQELEEYKSLREEILANDRLCLQAITIALSATGIIFGQGLANKNCWIFLIPMPILAVIYYYVTDKRFGTRVIASYIVAFLEPQLSGLNWETRLRRFREQCKKKGIHLIPGQNPMVNELMLFNLLIILSGTLFGIFTKNLAFVLVPFCLWLLFLLFSVYLYCTLIREGRKGDRFIKLWQDADTEANETATADNSG